MATEMKMPQLSDTMDAGKIISWKKKVGDAVNRGDILADVETDKANLDIECFQPGVLLKIVVPEGQRAKVGDVIAIIGAAGESVEGVTAAAAPAATAPQRAEVAERKTEGSTTESVAPQASRPAALEETAPERPEAETEAPAAGERIKASPLARRMAEDKGIDLSAVQGSGPGGRILAKDLEGAAPAAKAPKAPAAEQRPAARAAEVRAAGTPSQAGGVAGQLLPLSRMRETIARRMQESVTQAPHFFVTVSIDMEAAAKLQTALKELGEYKGISISHLVMKAAAYALCCEPGVNSAYRDGHIFQPGQINIGIITAVEEGLLIPVIKEVDKLSLADLVFEARAAIERARAGRPASSDLSGGTFSISNLGMFDVDSFTAIISPGQGAVLAVGSVKEQAVVRRGTLVPGLEMKATLSVDHRVIDGVMAANFMKHFKRALEVPGLVMR